MTDFHRTSFFGVFLLLPVILGIGLFQPVSGAVPSPPDKQPKPPVAKPKADADKLPATPTTSSKTESKPPDPADAKEVSLLTIFGKEKEEARRELEEMLAAERAEEEARIAKILGDPPLVDEPKKLLALDPRDKIWVDPEKKQVVALALVVLREGPLELLACRRRSKEHESILAMPIKPYLLHSGLLAIGALQGSPVKYHPAFQPPTGEKIDITLLWKDKQGRTRKVNAREWVAEAGKHVETVLPDGTVRKEKKTMETGWVFTGSVLYRDEDGMNRYIANETGEMVGLSNFVGSILDVPIQSTDSNDALLFEPYTSRIPPLGTAVTMIFEVEKPAEKPAGPPAVKPADTLSSPAESPKKKPRTP